MGQHPAIVTLNLILGKTVGAQNSFGRDHKFYKTDLNFLKETFKN